jgi:sec-independent protein translocase protein TatA
MNIQLFPTLAFLTPQTTLFLFAIVVMMFGAKKLPELARGMGLAIKEFTKAKNDINDEIMREPAPTPPQPAKQIDAEVAKAPAPQAQTETHV